MRAIKLLAAVLLAAAGRVHAAEFAELRAFKASEAKAAAEDGLKGEAWADKLSPSPAAQPAILLTVTAKDGIRLSAKGVYLASSNSPACTHVSFSDGGLTHLPNVLERAIPVQVSGETNLVKADRTLNDGCRSQLKGLSLNAAHERIMPEYGRIDILQGDKDPGMLVQKVAFRKITSPYLGVVFVSGDAKILVGPNGSAMAEVFLQAADGLKAAGAAAAVSMTAKSNYPGDYAYQKVHVLSKGPALVATVGSGIMDRKLIIGYKKSGILGGFDRISVVVRVTYYGRDGRMKVSERVLEMRKEWNGTGFMTPAMIQQDYITLVDNMGFRGIHSMELAFFAGSQWDSNYTNYVINPDEVAASNIQFVSTDGGTEINPSCWDFIVGQMRK